MRLDAIMLVLDFAPCRTICIRIMVCIALKPDQRSMGLCAEWPNANSGTTLQNISPFVSQVVFGKSRRFQYRGIFSSIPILHIPYVSEKMLQTRHEARDIVLFGGS